MIISNTLTTYGHVKLIKKYPREKEVREPNQNPTEQNPNPARTEVFM